MLRNFTTNLPSHNIQDQFVREKREKAGNGKMDKKKEQRSFEKRVHDQFVREKREKAGNGKMNKKNTP